MALMNRTSSFGRRANRGSISKSNSYDHDPMGPTAMVADIPKDIEGNYRRKKPNMKKSWCSCSTFMLLIIFVLIGGYAYVYYQERLMLKSQLEEQENTMRELEMNLSMKFDEKIKRLQGENISLKRKTEQDKELKIRNQELTERYRHLESQIRDVQQKSDTEKLLQKQKSTLEKNIQKMSKAACLEKFGPGPHLVEIHAKFDSHDKNKVDQGWILLELAPLDDMPHAVYWFLEQVSRGLYNGGSFHRNAGHVIQVGMHSNFLSDPKNPPTFDKFHSTGFSSVLFQEYSPNFPHKKYTIGYAGRPGGPEFYINTKDNSKSHGPGGQGHYEDPTEADVCFAKITKGTDLVDRIRKLPVKDERTKELKDNVAIVSVKVIKNPKS